MINTLSFVLDIKKPSIQRLRLVNGDTANVFVITIQDNGNAVTLDEDLHKVIAVFTRADGQIYTQDADTGLSFTTNGVVTIDVRPASYRTGTNKVCLQIYKREASTDEEYPLLLTTFEQQFTARVAAIPDAGAENAPSQLPMLEQIIADAGAAVAAAEEAVDACEMATDAAVEATTTANAAANNAIYVTAQAGSATASANAAAQAANDAASSANTAASSANTAAQGANAAAAAATTAAAAATSAAAEAAKRSIYFLRLLDGAWNDGSFYASVDLTPSEITNIMADSRLATTIPSEDTDEVFTVYEVCRADDFATVILRSVPDANGRYMQCLVDIMAGGVLVEASVHRISTLPDRSASDKGKYLHLNASTGALEWAALPLYNGGVS